jgi:uncharacterized protein (DUF433 family)
MSTVEELRRQVLELPDKDQEDVLTWLIEQRRLTRNRVAVPGIKSTPGVCGGSACVGNTRIPVWLLDSFRRLGSTEEELLSGYPGLRPEDLANAWKYAELNPLEIDHEILMNELA